MSKNNGSQALRVTPASAWRKPRIEGVLIELPDSGMVAKVRPVNVDTFIRVGHVPDALTVLVGKLTGGEGELNKMTNDDYLKLLDTYSAYAITCFVEPRVVEADVEPGEGEISVDDISDEDKRFLFQFMGRPAATLASFRPEQEKPVDNLERIESDAPSAE